MKAAHFLLTCRVTITTQSILGELCKVGKCVSSVTCCFPLSRLTSILSLLLISVCIIGFPRAFYIVCEQPISSNMLYEMAVVCSECQCSKYILLQMVFF